MPGAIKLILVEDHQLQLDGLKMLLEKQEGLRIVKTFNSSKEFLDTHNAIEFDVLLADLHMPDFTGIDLAEELKKNKHKAKVILLTMQRGTRFMQRAEKAGVEGYVLKTIGVEDLKHVVEKIHAGEIYYDPEIKKYNQEDDTHIKSTLTISEHPNELLSDREREILILVCQEYSSSQIAEKLFISTGTVDTHRKNILVKLGVSNTVGLVKYALKHGLLD